VVEFLPPGPQKNSSPREVIRALGKTFSLHCQRWSLTIREFYRTLRGRLTEEIWSVPKIRTLFLVFGALCIPVLIGIGLAVQAVNPVGMTPCRCTS